VNLWEDALTFPEWAELQPGSPVRQGDVLAALTPDSDSWRQLLVVLTADCDLAGSKHGGALSCVPVLTHVDYLLSYTYERLRGALLERLVRELLEVHIKAASSMPGFPQVSPSRLQQWLVESDTDSVVSTLRLVGQPALRFRELAREMNILTREVPASITSATRLLADAKLVLGDGKSRDKTATSVAADLASSLRKLPGDALFLNEVSPKHTCGYVVYLRRVIEVDDNSVVRTRSRLPPDAKFIRTSRLRSPYVYALSQQFGAVFSAIGLPTEYENARDSLLNRLKTVET
jgi:hypothetical protein